MKKLKYLVGRIFNLKFKQMKEKIEDINKKTNKSKRDSDYGNPEYLLQ